MWVVKDDENNYIVCFSETSGLPEMFPMIERAKLYKSKSVALKALKNAMSRHAKNFNIIQVRVQINEIPDADAT